MQACKALHRIDAVGRVATAIGDDGGSPEPAILVEFRPGESADTEKPFDDAADCFVRDDEPHAPQSITSSVALLRECRNTRRAQRWSPG